MSAPTIFTVRRNRRASKLFTSCLSGVFPGFMHQLTRILRDYNFRDDHKIYEINSCLQKKLSIHRYEHTLLTLEFALNLAIQNGIVDEAELLKISVAALSHDITKEEPPDFHHGIFLANGVREYMNLPPALYHAKSAPYFIAEKFGIVDTSVHHAIFFHSTGCGEMPLFSRIIFCADYLSSDFKEDKPYEPGMSLTDLCFEKISSTLRFLISKKMPVQPESINFYNVLIYESDDDKKDRNS